MRRSLGGSQTTHNNKASEARARVGSGRPNVADTSGNDRIAILRARKSGRFRAGWERRLGARGRRHKQRRETPRLHKLEELMNVKGIGEKSFLKLKSLITVAAAEKPGQ